MVIPPLRYKFCLISLIILSGCGSAPDISFNLDGNPNQFGGYFGPQVTVWDGAVVGNNFGRVVASVGDMDGDGNSDLLFGEPNANGGVGVAHVYSSFGGALLWTGTGAGAGSNFGYSVSEIGDVNQDGRMDFAVGSTGGMGFVRVVSGTGATLSTIVGSGNFFGSAIAAAGDLNGDQVPDFWVVVKSQAKVLGFSGANFQIIRTLNGPVSSDFGNSIVGGCRYDNDSVPDVVVGAPGTVVGGFDAGAVFVYSGANGSLLNQYLAGGAGQPNYPFGIAGLKYGTSVACLDSDQDGFDDVLVGVPYGENSQAGFGNRGLGFLYLGGSSPPATPFYTFMGLKGGDNLGSSVASAGDVDGDGYPDMILGAPFHAVPALPLTPQAGIALIYSGRTGSVIGSKTGTGAGDLFGASVFGLGDLDGDGKGDVGVYSSYSSTGAVSGQMEIFSF